MAIFKGAGVALVTPMKDNLEVNYEKLEELLEDQIKNETDSIIITGTTGEASTLTVEEHLEVIRQAVSIVNKRIPVIAGTGSNWWSHPITTRLPRRGCLITICKWQSGWTSRLSCTIFRDGQDAGLRQERRRR